MGLFIAMETFKSMPLALKSDKSSTKYHCDNCTWWQ